MLSLSVVLLCIIRPLESAIIDCANARSCEGDNLNAPQYDAMYLTGYKSAYGSTTKITTAWIVSCYGAFSCSEVDYITNNGEADVSCYGSNSCSNIDSITFGSSLYISTACYGSNSCQGTTFNYDLSASKHVYCQGDLSCANAIFLVTPHITAYGAYSLHNATIYSANTGNPDLSIQLTGYKSGHGAKIFCQATHTCTITCNANACTMLYVQCDGSCDITLNTADTIAPIYQLSALNISNTALLYDSSALTADNDVLCEGSGLKVDDASEQANGDDISKTTNGPTCCRGSSACLNIAIIQDTPSNDPIICGGQTACQGVTMSNSGSVFCTGNDACVGAKINTTNGGDIYCLGSTSCTNIDIYGVSNLYCSGSSACSGATISSTSDMNIYFTGYAGGQSTSIYCNVGHQCYILCGGGASCQPVSNLVCDGSCTVECNVDTGCPPGHTFSPTSAPTQLTENPTGNPTMNPTEPTKDPTSEPTNEPTTEPTFEPTQDPTNEPTNEPTTEPTTQPTYFPTEEPTFDPTVDPTIDPTTDPTIDPTVYPTMNPTFHPTVDPTNEPTEDPTMDPTIDPTSNPTTNPTNEPTTDPSVDPTIDPTMDPTVDPTSDPTLDPTIDPTIDPTVDPTNDPSNDPTVDPTVDPTNDPSVDPTNNPSIDPTIDPTFFPTGTPSLSPSTSPSATPTNVPLRLAEILAYANNASSDYDAYIYAVLIGVPCLLILIAFIMKLSVVLNKTELIIIDNPDYRSFLLYFIQLIDFYSDIIFSIQLYEYYQFSKFSEYGVYVDPTDRDTFYTLFVLCIIFTILPYIANIISSVRIVLTITNDTVISKYTKNYFKNNSTFYSVGVLLCGGSYYALKLVNTNFLSLPLLSAGLSRLQISAFATHKIIWTTCLENTPQFGIQCYFIFSLGIVTPVAVISMASSLFNIALSILSTVIAKTTNKKQEEFPFQIKLIPEENTQNTNPFKNAGRFKQLSQELKRLHVEKRSAQSYEFEILAFSEKEKTMYGVVGFDASGTTAKHQDNKSIEHFLDKNVEHAVQIVFETDAISTGCIYTQTIDDAHDLLKQLELHEYYSNFVEFGWNNAADWNELCENDEYLTQIFGNKVGHKIKFKKFMKHSVNKMENVEEGKYDETTKQTPHNKEDDTQNKKTGALMTEMTRITSKSVEND